MKKILKIGTFFLLCSTIVGCKTPFVASNISQNKSSNISNNINYEDEINKEHKITYVENEHCTISLTKEVAKRDEKIEIIVSNISKGYQVHKITANGFLVDNYSFIMPSEDVEIEVILSLVEDVVSGTVRYYVKSIPNKYALIETAKDYYAPGEQVEINYTCRGSYVLEKFFVNNEEIEGTTFTMPEDSVEISGTFIEAIPYTPWQVGCYAGGLNAISHWYFTYGDEGLNVNVKVEDARVCGEEFVNPNNSSNITAWSDNVEIILDKKNNNSGYVKDQTIKILVDYLGNNQFSIASSTTGWGASKSYATLIFNVSSALRYLNNNDGYNGYEINMFVSYSLFNLTRVTALNNLTACIAMRNTNSYNNSGTAWNCLNGDANIWKNSSKQPVIMEDGTITNR